MVVNAIFQFADRRKVEKGSNWSAQILRIPLGEQVSKKIETCEVFEDGNGEGAILSIDSCIAPGETHVEVSAAKPASAGDRPWGSALLAGDLHWGISAGIEAFHDGEIRVVCVIQKTSWTH